MVSTIVGTTICPLPTTERVHDSPQARSEGSRGPAAGPSRLSRPALALGASTLHGYAIMQSFHDLTGGAEQLLPGTLYATLARMVETGLIEESPGRGRRQASLLPLDALRQGRGGGRVGAPARALGGGGGPEAPRGGREVSGAGSRIPLGVRLFRVAVSAFPPAFAREHRAEMVETFQRELARHRGGWAAAWFTARSLGDVLGQGVVERLRRGPAPGHGRPRPTGGPEAQLTTRIRLACPAAPRRSGPFQRVHGRVFDVQVIPPDAGDALVRDQCGAEALGQREVTEPAAVLAED